MRLRAGFAKTLLTAAAIAFTAPVSAPAQETSQPSASSALTSADAANGLMEWTKIVAVLSHPRCSGCHVEDDRPRWVGDHYGGVRVHAFNVQRGTDGSGSGNDAMRCTSCHSASNSSVLHGAPGAAEWHLAPVEMAWFGKTSAQICAQVKDMQRNGGRTLKAIALHVRDNELVAWGWAPGEGREPAPGSAEQTYQALERWSAAGAPCPE